MLVSHNAALIEKARFWATQSRDPAPHYQHSEVGFNYRMSNVLAAIGRGQLRVLADRVNARRSNFEFYLSALGDLPGLSFMPEAPFGRSSRWLTCLTIDPLIAGTNREGVRLALAEKNIETRPVWKPMHLQPIFSGTLCFGGSVSEKLFEEGLCLPSGSNLTRADLERVASEIRRVWPSTS
jgi:pyridoxal phosphate-dependent aminotransferase EpsN